MRRTLVAFASALVPGSGQLINGRLRLAQWLALPFLLVVAIGILIVATSSPARLFASVVAPSTMTMLLTLNLVILGWRLVAVVHAFFDRRYEPRSGRAGAIGLALVLVAVVVPHGIANAWGTSAQSAFASIFTADRAGAGPGSVVANVPTGPGRDQRLNILLVGIDKLPWRTATLTDSLMVVSIDPVGETVTMVSLPRDLVRVPLGDGNVFGPKINSLMSYADRHPKEFPQGGMRALEDAVGALLGIPIHYYARIDFFGFRDLVDAVGGVDINVKKGWTDPEYDGIGINPKGVLGWTVEAGLQHFNGYEALAYARSRKGEGQSDYSRAAHQQEILLALRNRVMSGGDALPRLGDLVTALAKFVTTDLPTDRLPDLAAIADEMDPTSIVRVVLKKPLINTGGIDPVYGSIQVPDVPAIQEAARHLFPPPGETPIPWPTPVPTATALPASTPGPSNGDGSSEPSAAP